jgi:hypothetical protein
MVLYAYCVLIVFSLHPESLKLMLVDEPVISRVVLSQNSKTPFEFGLSHHFPCC